ncbi:hypothetical protein EBS80_01215 [bacterium]|nr:hypothetical protein [bacterium]
MSIDIYFYAFNESRADASSDAGDAEDAEQLEEYLSGDERVFRPGILNTLALTDLKKGSEAPRVTLDEPRWMEPVLDFLFRSFVPDQFFGYSLEWWQSIPTPVFISLFERLSVEKVTAAVDSMSDAQLAAYGVAREHLSGFKQKVVDLAFQIRPVVAACKRTGSRVIMAVNNEPDDARLMERARRRLDELCVQSPSLASRLMDAP